jgi:hypothetical protein
MQMHSQDEFWAEYRAAIMKWQGVTDSETKKLIYDREIFPLIDYSYTPLDVFLQNEKERLSPEDERRVLDAEFARQGNVVVLHDPAGMGRERGRLMSFRESPIYTGFMWEVRQWSDGRIEHSHCPCSMEEANHG